MLPALVLQAQFMGCSVLVRHTEPSVLSFFDHLEAFCTSSSQFSHNMQTCEGDGAQVLASIPPLGSQDGNERVGGGLPGPD